MNEHNLTCNNRNLRTVVSEVLLLILSGFVFSMAFPSFLSKSGFGFLSFIALIPVFYVIRKTTWPLAPLYGFIFGFCFYAIFNYWLTTFHPLAILIVTIIKAVEMTLLFTALKASDRWVDKKYSFITDGIIWVSYAYLSQSWFAGYPYGTIAYALYDYPLLIQIADIAGIWGITFLMIVPQSFLGKYFAQKRENNSVSLKTEIFNSKICIIIYLVLLSASLIYSGIALHYWNNREPDKEWHIAAIQHNADSWEGGYETYRKNFHNLQTMSIQALRENPDMIVWSETAFVPSVSWHTNYPVSQKTDNEYLENTAELVKEFVKFGKELPVPLLTGNPTGVLKDQNQPPYDENFEWNRDDYNSVILFDGGEIKQSYEKQHLVPFTEHFPYEKQLPWLYNILKNNGYHWWLEGEKSVVFETDNGITFSTPICFEDVFGYLIADFVNAGADLIVNMTNDSWSGSEAAETQHMAMGVFRSVENRKSTIRSTNSGITCLIDPSGHVIDPMTPFKMYWKMYDVPVYSDETNPKTFYTKYSDKTALVFVWCSFIILLMGGVIELLRKRKNK